MPINLGNCSSPAAERYIGWSSSVTPWRTRTRSPISNLAGADGFCFLFVFRHEQPSLTEWNNERIIPQDGAGDKGESRSMGMSRRCNWTQKASRHSVLPPRFRPDDGMET